MLTPKNKALLKRLANPLSPSLTVGKGEVDEKLAETVSKALLAHELIKVKVLPNQPKSLTVIAQELAKKTDSEVVEVIGRIVILYKKNQEKPVIVL